MKPVVTTRTLLWGVVNGINTISTREWGARGTRTDSPGPVLSVDVQQAPI